LTDGRFEVEFAEYAIISKEGAMSLNTELLDILVCPKSKAPLKLTEDGDGLYCEDSGLVYPIRDDIPILLVEEAIPVDEWRAGKREKSPKSA
jgi:hypothetical protein